MTFKNPPNAMVSSFPVEEIFFKALGKIRKPQHGLLFNNVGSHDVWAQKIVQDSFLALKKNYDLVDFILPNFELLANYYLKFNILKTIATPRRLYYYNFLFMILIKCHEESIIA